MEGTKCEQPENNSLRRLGRTFRAGCQSGRRATAHRRAGVSRAKFSTPMPPGVASPDTVEPRFGTLHFFDGVPDKASTEKIYDNLDYQRAVQAYLLALPVVNQAVELAPATLDHWAC